MNVPIHCKAQNPCLGRFFFGKLLMRGLFFEGRSTWPPFQAHPPNSLCLLLFGAEYAECKETSQKINPDTDQTHNLHVSFDINFFWVISNWEYYPSWVGSSLKLCSKLKFTLASIFCLYLKTLCLAKTWVFILKTADRISQQMLTESRISFFSNTGRENCVPGTNL